MALAFAHTRCCWYTCASEREREREEKFKMYFCVLNLLCRLCHCTHSSVFHFILFCFIPKCVQPIVEIAIIKCLDTRHSRRRRRRQQNEKKSELHKSVYEETDQSWHHQQNWTKRKQMKWKQTNALKTKELNIRIPKTHSHTKQKKMCVQCARASTFCDR